MRVALAVRLLRAERRALERRMVGAFDPSVSLALDRLLVALEALT